MKPTSNFARAGLIALYLMIAASAAARDVFYQNSHAVSAGGTVLITPARTGISLGAAGATVTLTVLDAGGHAVPNFPWYDTWLDSDDPGDVSLCWRGSVADGNSNALGVMTFNNPIAGGGYCEYTKVYMQGEPLLQAPFNLGFHSPDINGDLIVDLTDFGRFGQDFGSSEFRSDFVHDGVVDLADFSRFGVSYWEQCP